MVRVFLDAGVLIGAFKGQPDVREVAFTILDCPLLEFWYSPFVDLEIVLQASHHGRTNELAFYREYFNRAACFGDIDRIFQVGSRDAKLHGISAMDAFHVAAANLSKCSALITTEKATKPIFRTNLVRVLSLPTPGRSAQTILQLTSG